MRDTLSLTLLLIALVTFGRFVILGGTYKTSQSLLSNVKHSENVGLLDVALVNIIVSSIPLGLMSAGFWLSPHALRPAFAVAVILLLVIKLIESTATVILNVKTDGYTPTTMHRHVDLTINASLLLLVILYLIVNIV